MNSATDIPDLAGQVQTVLGPVNPAALGATLMHEHIFIDLRRPAHALRPGEDSAQAQEQLTLANLAGTRHGHPNASNDMLSDFDEMLGEVAEYERAGGGTIVDVTPAGVGRDPVGLAGISRATGLHVVMGSGWYTPTFHPLDLAERSVDDLADAIVRDVVVGVAGTGIRAGIIGEIGSDGSPLSAMEWKSIRAGARASARTGAPMTFHVGGVGEEKFDVLDLLIEEGVATSNVVIGHAGGLGLDLPFARRILDRGVFIEADFLASPGSPWGHLVLLGDHAVAKGLGALVAEGFGSQLVLGHDVCQKIQLKRYGGHGFTYIHEHFLPALRAMGVDHEALHAMMVDNPARALTFTSPRRPAQPVESGRSSQK